MNETDDHTSPTIRERLQAARAAAEEVVAEESGQLGGEVSALAVPFEQVVAAVSAAINPESLGDHAGEDAPPPLEHDTSSPPT